MQHFGPWTNRNDFLIWWGGSQFISLAFWICAFWLTVLPGVDISGVFHVCIALIFCYGLIKTPAIPRPNRLSVLFLLILFLLYFIPFFTRIYFHLGDMTMNLYTARIIEIHGKIPESHEPLLAISEFGQYALGTHLLNASISLLSGFSTHRVSFFLFCYFFHLLFLSFYFLISPSHKRAARFLAVFLFLFFARYPQAMLQWGSMTTVASLSFLILLFSVLPKVGELNRTGVLIAAMLCAAAPLSHSIPLFGFLLFFPPYYLIMKGPPNVHEIKNFMLIGLAAMFLCVGQLFRLPSTPTPQWEEWAHVWNLSHFRLMQPLVEKIFGISDITPLSIPFAYVAIFGIMATVCPILALPWVKDRRLHPLFGVFLLTAALILLSKVYPFIPFNYALYPERVLMFMGVPIVLLYTSLTQKISSKTCLSIVLAAVCMFAVAGKIISQYEYKSIYRLYKEAMISPLEFAALHVMGGDYIVYALDDINSSLTQDDLAVIEWIKDNIDRSEVIGCSYFGGGGLIPVIAGNKIDCPHYQKFWYEDEFTSWLRGQEIKYFFHSPKLNNRDPEPDPGQWQSIHARGEAAIYKRIETEPD